MKGVQQKRTYILLRRQGKFIFMFVVACIINNYIAAQKFTATTDRDKMLIGEQLILTLQLVNYNPLKFTCDGWPAIPDSFQHCEVIKRGPIDTILINNLQTLRQQLVITSFDSGLRKIGACEITLVAKDNSRKSVLKAPAIPLTVLMPDVSNLMDYHEMKDVIDVPEPFDWTFAVITTLIAFVITFLLWKLFTRQKPKAGAVIAVPPEQALTIALKKLEAIHNSSLNNKAAIRQYHASLDTIVREYIENASGIKALKATSNELLQQLPVYITNNGVKEKIENIFYLNTAVKYAMFLPVEKESRRLREDIIYCLKILDDSIQQAHRYAG